MAQEHQQGKLLLDLKLRLETDLVLAANSRFRVNSLNTTVEVWSLVGGSSLRNA